MTTRATTIFQLVDPSGDLDELIRLIDMEPEAQRSGAGYNADGHPRLLFRAANADVAISLVRAIGADYAGSKIYTGLGVHRKLVKEF